MLGIKYYVISKLKVPFIEESVKINFYKKFKKWMKKIEYVFKKIWLIDFTSTKLTEVGIRCEIQFSKV